MISIEYQEAFSETLDILKHTKREDISKIPPKFIKFLKENASKTYKPQLDHSKRLKDMNLKNKTKLLLSIIYKKYMNN